MHDFIASFTPIVVRSLEDLPHCYTIVIVDTDDISKLNWNKAQGEPNTLDVRTTDGSASETSMLSPKAG